MTLPQRIDSKIDRSGGPDACWPWTGGRIKGYGQTTIHGRRRVYAHRLALMDALGRELLPGYMALHHCDNPPCCNPAHLYEGTAKDNSFDAHTRGRAVNLRGSKRPDVRVRLLRENEERSGLISLSEEDWAWFQQKLEDAARAAIRRFVERAQRGDLTEPEPDLLVKIEDPEAQALWWSERQAA